MGMMINRRRACGGKSLPYDAEIEYLESTGTQYIITNLNVNQNTGFEVKYYWENKSDWSFKESANNVLFGTRDANSNNAMYLFMNASDGTKRFFRFFSIKVNYYQPFTYNNTSIIEGQHVLSYLVASNGTLKLDGSTLKTGTKANSFTSVKPLAVFTLNRDGVFDWIACSKIYYLKMYELSNLVADFIPVRIGQVGYLYDKVSGQLFGNQGTGNFILGPDV